MFCCSRSVKDAVIPRRDMDTQTVNMDRRRIDAQTQTENISPVRRLSVPEQIFKTNEGHRYTISNALMIMSLYQKDNVYSQTQKLFRLWPSSHDIFNEIKVGNPIDEEKTIQKYNNFLKTVGQMTIINREQYFEALFSRIEFLSPLDFEIKKEGLEKLREALI